MAGIAAERLRVQWLESMLDTTIVAYEAHRSALEGIYVQLHEWRCGSGSNGNSGGCIHIAAGDAQLLLDDITEILDRQALQLEPMPDEVAAVEDETASAVEGEASRPSNGVAPPPAVEMPFAAKTTMMTPAAPATAPPAVIAPAGQGNGSPYTPPNAVAQQSAPSRPAARSRAAEDQSHASPASVGGPVSPPAAQVTAASTPSGHSSVSFPSARYREAVSVSSPVASAPLSHCASALSAATTEAQGPREGPNDAMGTRGGSRSSDPNDKAPSAAEEEEGSYGCSVASNSAGVGRESRRSVSSDAIRQPSSSARRDPGAAAAVEEGIVTGVMSDVGSSYSRSTRRSAAAVAAGTVSSNRPASTVGEPKSFRPTIGSVPPSVRSVTSYSNGGTAVVGGVPATPSREGFSRCSTATSRGPGAFVARAEAAKSSTSRSANAVDAANTSFQRPRQPGTTACTSEMDGATTPLSRNTGQQQQQQQPVASNAELRSPTALGQRRPLRTSTPRRGTGYGHDSRQMERKLYHRRISPNRPPVVADLPEVEAYMRQEDAELIDRREQELEAIRGSPVRTLASYRAGMPYALITNGAAGATAMGKGQSSSSPLDAALQPKMTAVEEQLMAERTVLQMQLEKIQMEIEITTNRHKENGTERRYSQLNHRMARVLADMNRVDAELVTVQRLEKSAGRCPSTA